MIRDLSLQENILEIRIRINSRIKFRLDEIRPIWNHIENQKKKKSKKQFSAKDSTLQAANPKR